MARKQTRRSVRKTDIRLAAGEIVQVTGKAEASARFELEGSCDKAVTTISQTNGNVETINWPKNTGDCGDWVVLVSLDKQKMPVQGTEFWLGRNKTIKSYKSPAGAYSVGFYCPDTEHGGKCKLEIDRD
jgi:hypothetical protein